MVNTAATKTRTEPAGIGVAPLRRNFPASRMIVKSANAGVAMARKRRARRRGEARTGEEKRREERRREGVEGSRGRWNKGRPLFALFF